MKLWPSPRAIFNGIILGVHSIKCVESEIDSDTKITFEMKHENYIAFYFFM